ncbi:unnamed protein product [Pleuronectes platessa]|uniref:Uncharacterized protein n=1 Tax=Pleuronectes platessa TaxID=8262 RepID=A0A9N7Z563_PLEPL|nr:unnamed protein product [Pleuronectes platessa]
MKSSSFLLHPTWLLHYLTHILYRSFQGHAPPPSSTPPPLPKTTTSSHKPMLPVQCGRLPLPPSPHLGHPSRKKASQRNVSYISKKKPGGSVATVGDVESRGGSFSGPHQTQSGAVVALRDVPTPTGDVCVCVRGAAACVRPQPTTPAVRITAGTREDLKKGTQPGLRPLASLHEGPRHRPSGGPQRPRCLIETASFGTKAVFIQDMVKRYTPARSPHLHLTISWLLPH